MRCGRNGAWRGDAQPERSLERPCPPPRFQLPLGTYQPCCAVPRPSRRCSPLCPCLAPRTAALVAPRTRALARRGGAQGRARAARLAAEPVAAGWRVAAAPSWSQLAAAVAECRPCSVAWPRCLPHRQRPSAQSRPAAAAARRCWRSSPAPSAVARSCKSPAPRGRPARSRGARRALSG